MSGEMQIIGLGTPGGFQVGFTISFPQEWPVERCRAVTDAACAADRIWREQRESAENATSTRRSEP